MRSTRTTRSHHSRCQDELLRLFYGELPVEGIKKDVASLKATYQAVIDAEGGYVHKQFR